jgi:hypothetical protein
MAMMVSLSHIADVLTKYQLRYRWLNVLVSDVAELVSPSAQLFQHVADDCYRTAVGARTLEIRLYRHVNVARFSLAREPLVLEGALAGGLLVGAVAASMRRNVPADIILGLLVGRLTGTAAAVGNERPDESRIMALAFDAETIDWRVYHGPYLDWARIALLPLQDMS